MNKYSLFHQLVVNIWTYLPQKGNVRENNECRRALVIFADFSLLRQIFPHNNFKLIKYISSDHSVNKCHLKQKVVPDFRHGENVHSDTEISPHLKLRHFFTNNISKNRHMKYYILFLFSEQYKTFSTQFRYLKKRDLSHSKHCGKRKKYWKPAFSSFPTMISTLTKTNLCP